MGRVRVRVGIKAWAMARVRVRARARARVRVTFWPSTTLSSNTMSTFSDVTHSCGYVEGWTKS